MFIIDKFLIITLLLSFFNIRSSVQKYDVKINGFDFTINDKENYYANDNNIVVYGNYKFIDPITIKNTIENSKIAIFYDTDLSNNVKINHQIYNNNVSIYYEKNNIRKNSQFITNSSNKDNIKEEIKEFILTKLNKKNENLPNFQSQQQNNVFDRIYEGDFVRKQLPYGQIEGNYNILKYRYNDVSSLYNIESSLVFIPGSKMINIDNSYKKWNIRDVFVRLETMPASLELSQTDIRKGGKPILKDFYPDNNPFKKEIISTYNNSLSIGYSYVNGFSLYYAVNNDDYNYGSMINYYYDKKFHSSNSRLETYTGVGLDRNNLVGWKLIFDKDQNQNIALNTGYLFEKNNHNHELDEDDFMFVYDIDVEYSKFLSSNEIVNKKIYVNYC